MVVEEEITDLGVWQMSEQENFQEILPVFNIDPEIETDADWDRSQIGGVLQSQRDVFLQTIFFQFSPTFFKARGLDSKHTVVQINGIVMNSLNTGRPLWNTWGGLNDFLNQGVINQYGLSPTNESFGGILGSTIFTLRPSLFRKRTKISQVYSNGSYTVGSYVSHVSEKSKKGWTHSFLTSGRWGEGFIEGTTYTANSFFVSIEKEWDKIDASSWLTIFYTPSQRGKNAPLTQEVFDLKGLKYNPYWGIQDKNIRNSRVATNQIPIAIFSYKRNFNSKMELQFNFAFQTGQGANSRISFNGKKRIRESIVGGASNPSPIYYQKLPSYFLRNTDSPDYLNASLARKNIVEDGTLNWQEIYRDNYLQPDGSAVYAFYEDVVKEQKVSGSVFFNYQIFSNTKLFSNVYFSAGNIENYAEVTDLLGSERLWDYDSFASDLNAAQNNLKTPDRSVQVGDKFQYHYDIFFKTGELNVQAVFEKDRFMAFGATQLKFTEYQREGYFQNGLFPDSSFGKGQKTDFLSPTFKAGFRYAFTGQHYFSFNGALSKMPPIIRNIYTNPRKNNNTIPILNEEKTLSLAVSYTIDISTIKTFLRSYYILEENLTDISFYFAQGINGEESLFVQEILLGLSKEHKGVEFGFEWQVLPEIKIKSAFAIGNHQFANHPQLILTSENIETERGIDFVERERSFGQSYIKGYFLPTGPQQAFSLNIEYRDPKYWWLSVAGNYFLDSYIDINPLLRTQNFYSDTDGFPFIEYSEKEAEKLLQQEKIPSYFLVNLSGGKSWKVGNGYLGIFVGLQNILNTIYRTGGFEQGRNANFRTLKEDRDRDIPLFGNKYWWGRGNTFYTKMSYQF